MISYLYGKLILKKEKFLILEVNGVGYKVFVSKKSILNLPEIGQNLKLFCFHDVREVASDLYGFFSYEELEFFEMLNDIHGIGPKAGIELSSLGPLDKIKDRILKHDDTLFAGIPGIGQKKAMTIILELTGKITNLQKHKAGSDEVEDTLSGLGFPKQKIKDALSQLPKNLKDPQERVKQAIKIMGQN